MTTAAGDGSLVERVRRERLAYPTSERPTWRTVTPDEAITAELPDIAPADLAVVDTESGEIVLVAVVEASDALSDGQAINRWLPASRLAPLFLYVPQGSEGEASRLCRELLVPVAGLRTHALEIRDARAPLLTTPIAWALLPEALRPGRFRITPPRAPEPPEDVVVGGRRVPRIAQTSDLVMAVLVWALVTAVAEVLLVFVVDGMLFPARGAEEADEIDRAFRVMSYMAAPVFGLVVAVLLYSPARFRSPGTPQGDGAPMDGRGTFPVVWLGVTTALAIVVMIYPGLVGLAELRDEQFGDLEINVTAFQFGWQMEYVESGLVIDSRETLTLPVDRRVQFNVRSTDVLHSFWIPAFRVKIDALPQQTRQLYVTPDRVSNGDTVYRVQCAELCGDGHPRMTMPLAVVEEADYETWLAEKLAEGTEPPQPPSEGAVQVDVALSEFAIAPGVEEAPAGPISFRAFNDGTALHEVVVVRTDLPADGLPVEAGVVVEDALDVRGRTPLLGPGGSDELTVDLEPGRYVLICNVAGHYQLGMYVEFVVTEGEAREAAPISAEVDATLSDFAIAPEIEAVDAGRVGFTVTNEGNALHEFVVVRSDLPPGELPVEAGVAVEDELDVVGRTALIEGGDVGRLTVELQPGAYLLICNVPGHYQLGMVTAFQVR